MHYNSVDVVLGCYLIYETYLCFNSAKVQLSSGKQLCAWLEDPESEDDENQGEHVCSDHDSSYVGEHSVDLLPELLLFDLTFRLT
jgi:hypothetical protein